MNKYRGKSEIKDKLQVTRGRIRNRGNETTQEKEMNKRRNTKRRKRRYENRKRRKEVSVHLGLRIMYVNINGIRSKIKSLESVTEAIQPDVITLTEVKSQTIPSIKNYSWIHKKREKGKGGGLAIGIHHKTKQIPMEQLTEEDDDTEIEILWSKIIKGNNAYHIGVYYGKQEGHNEEAVEDEYSKLTTQINRLRMQGEIILTGDFNAKLQVTQNNKQIQKESRNGRIMKNMIKNTDLKVTTLNNITRGIWTRQNRQNASERSIIDYILCTEETDKSTTLVIIDEEGIMRMKGKHVSDHNTIYLEIENNKMQSNERQKAEHTNKQWKINRDTKWTKFNEFMRREINDIKTYSKLHNTIIEALEITVGKSKNRNTGKTKFAKYIENVKNEKNNLKHEIKTLNKAIRQGKQLDHNQLNQLYANYNQKKDSLIQMVRQDQHKRAEKITQRIKEEGGINSHLFWKYVKNTKKRPTETYDILDNDEKPITNPEKCKDYTAKYFQNLYKPWEPEEECKEELEKIRKDNEKAEKEPSEQFRITTKEFNKAISKMKNGKACGPDDIPNEAITKADKDIRNTYKNIIEGIINKKENIPIQWKNGNIITIYKGKGKKGLLKNERGITLSSNMGKVAERIIANKITEEINITDYQAGGKKNSSTSDHLTILNNVIYQNKKQKKTTYLCFMDVTKAYDKAWLEGIMHVMNKNGIEGTKWKMTRELSNNLKAKVQTRHGPTQEFEINDSIKQGGVLSVIQYATLIDEIAKNIDQEKIGCKQGMTDKKIGCLLWMDDVVLIAENTEDMHKMLKITHDTAQRYRIKFGEEKTKIMRIGKGAMDNFILGNINIGQTDKYKYLGYMLNEKANSQDHIQALKGKAEIAFQTIQSITGNMNLRNIHMKSTWKLLKATVIPIITYAGESMTYTKKETEQMNKILDNIIRRILNTPRSTPRETIYLECGLLDIETTINKNKLLMYNRIYRTGNTLTKEIISDENNTKWKEEIEILMNRYNIEKKTIQEKSKKIAKNKINSAIKETFRKELIKEGIKKSKVRYYLLNSEPNHENPINKKKKENYLNTLSQPDVSLIFNIKTRMIDVKNNYKNRYHDNICRHCKTEAETQEHILEKCSIIHENNRSKAKICLIKSFSPTILKQVAIKARKILELHQTQ